MRYVKFIVPFLIIAVKSSLVFSDSVYLKSGTKYENVVILEETESKVKWKDFSGDAIGMPKNLIERIEYITASDAEKILAKCEGLRKEAALAVAKEDYSIALAKYKEAISKYMGIGKAAGELYEKAYRLVNECGKEIKSIQETLKAIAATKEIERLTESAEGYFKKHNYSKALEQYTKLRKLSVNKGEIDKKIENLKKLVSTRGPMFDLNEFGELPFMEMGNFQKRRNEKMQVPGSHKAIQVSWIGKEGQKKQYDDMFEQEEKNPGTSAEKIVKWEMRIKKFFQGGFIGELTGGEGFCYQVRVICKDSALKKTNIDLSNYRLKDIVFCTLEYISLIQPPGALPMHSSRALEIIKR